MTVGCTQREEPPAVEQPNADAGGDARIQDLERRVTSIIRTDGCASGGQCATAPLGAKPCGGPRTYVVYCKATTDEAALTAALDELRRAEEARNRASGMVSDCMMVMPPETAVQGGRCVAAQSQNTAPLPSP
jgi:hypothetical protein